MSPGLPSPHARSINGILRSQNLSHTAFHSGLKKVLGRIWQNKWKEMSNNVEPLAVVVGVEYGAEASDLGSLGYQLELFEPNENFADATHKKLEFEGISHKIHKVALGNSTGNGIISYQGEQFSTFFDRLDRYVSSSISILSLDTQGTEYEILQGAGVLIETSPPLIKMIWIEISTTVCETKLRSLLELLQQKYVLMDFVWWGKPLEEDDEFFSHNFHNISHYEIVKEDLCLDEYINAFCKQDGTFSWLQSDIVAIERSLFTPDLKKELMLISYYCWDEFKCPLREHRINHNQPE